jgi:hypothetical protein
MKKIVIINNCDECPNFDNEYYGYEEYCTKLGRRIGHISLVHHTPDDCPLPDAEELV